MADSKPHILFVSAWYPNRYDSMWGLFVQRHAESIVPYCQVSVLYVHSSPNLQISFYIEHSTEDGLNTYRIYYKKANTNLNSLNRLLNILRYIYYQHKGITHITKNARKPDLIHVNILTRSGIVPYFLKLTKHIPYVITEHWSRYLSINNKYQGCLRKFFTKQIVKHAAAVMPVTKNLQAAMLHHALTNPNYRVIPNVVDTDVFVPATKNNTIKTLIHISCFEDKSKNITGLLRVIKQVADKRNDFQLILVGDGIDKPAIEEYYKTLDISNKCVLFTGLLEGQALITQLQQAHCLLIFSNYENMPVVINESFACGIPVIATRVGGIAEVVNESNGILVEPNDEQAMAIAIHTMLDKLDKYDSSSIRKQAVDQFSKEAIGKQFLNIYLNAIG